MSLHWIWDSSKIGDLPVVLPPCRISLTCMGRNCVYAFYHVFTTAFNLSAYIDWVAASRFWQQLNRKTLEGTLCDVSGRISAEFMYIHYQQYINIFIHAYLMHIGNECMALVVHMHPSCDREHSGTGDSYLYRK